VDIKKLVKAFTVFILAAGIIGIFYFNSMSIMFSSNMEKSINKFWNNKVSIKEVKDKEYFMNAYKGEFQDIVKAVGKDGSDMTNVLFTWGYQNER